MRCCFPLPQLFKGFNKENGLEGTASIGWLWHTGPYTPHIPTATGVLEALLQVQLPALTTAKPFTERLVGARHCSPHQPYEVGTAITPVLQMRKRKHGEPKQPVQAARRRPGGTGLSSFEGPLAPGPRQRPRRAGGKLGKQVCNDPAQLPFSLGDLQATRNDVRKRKPLTEWGEGTDEDTLQKFPRNKMWLQRKCFPRETECYSYLVGI